MSNLDKSLDEVISTHKAGRRGARRGAKAALVGSAPVAAARTRARPATALVAQTAAVPQVADKIIVSNLPIDVNESQIRELFQTMIGPLREVIITYDSAGRSKGIASVVFTRKGDGSKAYTQYHNRLIDGKRPMKIEIVLDPSAPAPPPSLVARVAAVPGAANGAMQSTITAERGGRGRGGGGRRGRGTRRQGNDRPAKTAEDLDAEMEDYTGTAPTTVT